MKLKQFIKKYWHFAAISICAVLFWIYIVPHPERELRMKYEQERKDLKYDNERKEKHIKRLQADSIQIRLEMAERSTQYAERERENQKEYDRLKRSKNKVDYSNADNKYLDSIRHSLYPR